MIWLICILTASSRLHLVCSQDCGFWMFSIECSSAKPRVESLICKHPCSMYWPKFLNAFWNVMQDVICHHLEKKKSNYIKSNTGHEIYLYCPPAPPHLLWFVPIFYSLNSFTFYWILMFTCRDNGKSLSSRARATATCCFKNWMLSLLWEGAQIAEMASMNRIKLSCCSSPSMSLTQYFSIPRAAT